MKEEILLFYKSLLNVNTWRELSDSKMRARYNRTVLGPFWEIFGSLFLLLLLAYLWSKLWNKDFVDFFTYLLIGYTLWRTILSTVTDACMLFTHTYSLVLKNVKINPFIFAISCSYKNILTLLYNFPLIFLVLFLNNQLNIISFFILIVFLFFFFMSSISASFLLGVLCLKYRDLEHTLGVILGILFFFTPIIWSVDQLGSKTMLIQPNILYHYINFFRSGLQFGSIDILNFVVVFFTSIFLFISAMFVSIKTKKKLAHWLD